MAHSEWISVQFGEGIERLDIQLSMMTTSEGSAPPSELSSMKLDELREMCKDLGLMVSGKKSDLIKRILGESVVMDAESVGIESPNEDEVPSSNENVGDAVDRLLARFDKDGSDSKEVVEPTGEAIPEPEVKLPEGAPDIPKEGYLRDGRWSNGPTMGTSGLRGGRVRKRREFPKVLPK